MRFPGFWSRLREQRQRLASRCGVCGAEVREWLRVGIDREYGCAHGDVEVLDCDDLLHLCGTCAIALEEEIRDAVVTRVTTYLQARGLTGTESKEM
jgi:bacterioferritin-associated ferredoxin